jgi:hypothetical protein
MTGNQLAFIAPRLAVATAAGRPAQVVQRRSAPWLDGPSPGARGNRRARHQPVDACEHLGELNSTLASINTAMV